MSARAAAIELDLAPPAITRVEAERVHRWFERVDALVDVSFTFVSGTVVTVLGPNGAGKTTLLHLLATLDGPSEGRLVFNDRYESRAERHRIRPHIGLVGHDTLLYGDLSGAENLAFFSRLYGLSAGVADAWLRRVGLGDVGDRPVRAYSRGMRQRLSIARALLHEPSLVLFDEPATGLDRASRGFLWSVVAWLRAQGRIVVAVTHQMEWPTDIVDRVLVLDDGRVRFDGAPDGAGLGVVYDRAVRAR